MPFDKVLAPVRVTSVELPGVRGLVPKVTLVPAGAPLALSWIGVEKPLVTTVPKVVLAAVDPLQTTSTGAGEVKS